MVWGRVKGCRARRAALSGSNPVSCRVAGECILKCCRSESCMWPSRGGIEAESMADRLVMRRTEV